MLGYPPIPPPPPAPFQIPRRHSKQADLGALGGGGGAHAHRTTARQAMDSLWTEACGQQKQSNDPGNNQHNPQ